MSQLIKRITKKGFTLIELMIVVAIIGILAAIAIPKFADLITKSRESSIKGSLGAVRGAITIYYSDTEGTWPGPDGAAASFVNALTLSGKYLEALPGITIPKNSNGNGGHSAVAANVAPAIGAAANAGGWVYVSSATGQFLVNCNEQDTKAVVWSTY